MKRFFAVTSTSSSSSKGNDGASPPNKKRALPWPATGAAASPNDGPRPPPLKFMSWNVNSLLQRIMKGDWAGFEALVAREKPDLIALFEVMLPAAKGADLKRRTRMHAGDTAAAAAERELVYSRVVHGMGYQVALSLADTKQAGTLVMLRRELKESARAIHYAFPGAKEHHEPDGRFMLLEFHEFDVLATYVPNHGYTTDSFERRRLWDERMLAFLKARTKPLVWLGDLNVSHLDHDVSSPNFFASQKGKGQNPPPLYKGQPGYTAIERERFREMLVEGKLVDAYRHLHPARGDNDWTWRGYGGNTKALYYGKGMRIDYTIISSSLLAPPHNFQIKRAEVLGHGAERTGFFGSDHCPVLLELERVGPPAPAPPPSPSSSPGTTVTASAAAAAAEDGNEGAGNGGAKGEKAAAATKEDVVDLTASG